MTVTTAWIFLCLQEIKCTGFQLEANLKKTSNKMLWMVTSHQDGKGGAAIGINFKHSSFVSNVVKDDWFITVTVSSPFMFTLVNVYAHNQALVRADVWKKINQIQGQIILLGDFNMVETLKDIWKGLGQPIQGSELHEWNDLVEDKSLIDMSACSGFSWTNHQKGEF